MPPRRYAAIAIGVWALAWAAGGSADAAHMIGVNFVGKYTTPMDFAETAGVVPQAHWNNVKSGLVQPLALTDDIGTVTGATVEWRGVMDYTAISDTAGNNRLMRGYLAPLGATDPPTATFRGLSAAFPLGYDVIVYFDGSNDIASPDVAWVMNLVVGGQSRTVRDPANTNFSGTYVEDTGAGGNTARFHGLTADVLTVTATPHDGTKAALNGIQLIHTPEPATAGLMAAGLAALVWRRRRRLRKAAGRAADAWASGGRAARP